MQITGELRDAYVYTTFVLFIPKNVYEKFLSCFWIS